jgi:GT2 family glycosyltransferase
LGSKAMTAPHAVSIVIVTKDRWTELERAVRSALAQGVAEVIVVDDASTDRTPELVEREFPNVRLVRSAESRGYIVRRNEAAELSRAGVLVSIDDDAEFTSTDTVARLLRLFDHHRIGAATIPHIDLLQGSTVQQQRPSGRGVYVTHWFRGTAYAVRRDRFRELGGFRESFFHQGEEQDLCLRLLAAGSFVAMVDAPPVLHHASTSRDPLRAWTYGPRNDVLFAWHNVPMPALLTRLLEVSLYQLWLGLGVRRPLLFARSLANGYASAFRARSRRRPVSRRAYRVYRTLEKGGPILIDEVPEVGQSHG